MRLPLTPGILVAVLLRFGVGFGQAALSGRPGTPLFAPVASVPVDPRNRRR